MEVGKPTNPILTYRQCLIDKFFQVSCRDIKDTFMKNKFPQVILDKEVYNNFKRSQIHKISCKLSMMPCVDTIEWISSHMDDKKLVLQSESGDGIVIYYGHDMHTFYNMLKPREYVNTTFYTRWANLNTGEIIKSWCQEPTKYR